MKQKKGQAEVGGAGPRSRGRDAPLVQHEEGRSRETGSETEEISIVPPGTGWGSLEVLIPPMMSCGSWG